jgi:hypothetical protein
VFVKVCRRAGAAGGYGAQWCGVLLQAARVGGPFARVPIGGDAGEVVEADARVVGLHQDQEPPAEEHVVTHGPGEDVKDDLGESFFAWIAVLVDLREVVVVVEDEGDSAGIGNDEIAAEAVVQGIEILAVVVGEGKSGAKGVVHVLFSVPAG